MLTAKEWAKKISVDASSVADWCRKGLVPGAVQAPINRSQFKWLVPDDAERPDFTKEVVIVENNTKKFSPCTIGMLDENHKKQLDYINTHQSKSVRSIATALGVSTAKVRELYEELLQLNNPCNPLTCQAYATGYCEYDFATGQIMPMDEENCPLLKKEEK